MSAIDHSVADFSTETYPVFKAKIQDSYIDGYDPVSYTAPHSSLVRTSTWVGMGLIMSILPAIGILTWGLGTILYTDSSQADISGQTLAIIGAVMTVVVSIAAIMVVRHGRRFYREYRRETGRIN